MEEFQQYGPNLPSGEYSPYPEADEYQPEQSEQRAAARDAAPSASRSRSLNPSARGAAAPLSFHHADGNMAQSTLNDVLSVLHGLVNRLGQVESRLPAPVGYAAAAQPVAPVQQVQAQPEIEPAIPADGVVAPAANGTVAQAVPPAMPAAAAAPAAVVGYAGAAAAPGAAVPAAADGVPLAAPMAPPVAASASSADFDPLLAFVLAHNAPPAVVQELMRVRVSGHDGNTNRQRTVPGWQMPTLEPLVAIDADTISRNETFLEAFKAWRSIQAMSAPILSLATCALKGVEGERFLSELRALPHVSDDDFYSRFILRFANRARSREADELHDLLDGKICMGGDVKTVQAYFALFSATLARAGGEKELPPRSQVDRFMRGLSDELKPHCQSDANGRDFINLQSLYDHCLGKERMLSAAKHTPAPLAPPKPIVAAVRAKPSIRPSPKSKSKSYPAIAAAHPSKEIAPVRPGPYNLKKGRRMTEEEQRQHRQEHPGTCYCCQQPLTKAHSYPSCPTRPANIKAEDDKWARNNKRMRVG